MPDKSTHPSSTAGDGKVAVVTGGTGGIGKKIVRGLLRRNMTVIIGVRSLEKGEALRAELADDPAGGRIEVLPLNVASMQSVRAFAAAIAQTHPTLHLLINNAGAWFNERGETGEGHELTLATNVAGPYLLARLLLPRLRAAGAARIVNIVSSAVGDYDVSDLEWTKRRYDGFRAYRQSKQALLMVTSRLAQQLAGSGVVVNAASPGFVKTAFLKDAKGFVATALRLISFLAVSPEKGAETPLWVALAPELNNVSGKLFEGRKQKVARLPAQAALDDLEKALDRMTGSGWNTAP
ncbi:MAG: SDR family NAD(P)-dependent oxidoreductase [Paracoccus sp. (in: a-proteobacteria)]|uniref:SDR family NAD(P)-dependent oxidoreductase n=1 Tax=Paracoccus sp. TaxID=267 RepID=UPI0039E31B23